MKRIIEVDENLICEGFVRNFTEEEKDVLISAVRNSIPYEERPQGVWIFDGVYRDENNPIDNDMYHCNLCKRSIMTACEIPTDLFPFCHCGAKMKNGGKDKREL